MDKKKRPTGEEGLADYEGSIKDESEKIEWEEYYETRNKRLAWQNRDNDE